MICIIHMQPLSIWTYLTTDVFIDAKLSKMENPLNHFCISIQPFFGQTPFPLLTLFFYSDPQI